MANFYPENDAAFSVWLGNFITVANANLAALGLTAADITALQALKTDLDAKVTAANAAREASKAATAALQTSRRNANVQSSFRGKVIVANPNITNSLKEQLGLNVRDSVPTSSVPTVPADLVAEAFSNGVNRLKWVANGNKSGTQYVIEGKFGTASDFTFVNVTTKTKFDHAGQTPGERVFYRVRARRGDTDSSVSNEAVVYAG